MSVARCTKCKGLLPAWLEAGDPANARCPNCGHVNDLSAARTPAPAPQDPHRAPMKSTGNYGTLAAQGATKSPSFNKTMLMGSGAAKSPEIEKAVALAKTMMMPAGPPAEAKPPQKRVPTLPSLGSTEILPAPAIPVPLTPLPQLATPAPLPKAATPAPAVKAATPAPMPKAPPPTPPPSPALGAMPQHADPTDVDISVEIDTPPPAPPSQTSIPAWAVPEGVEDLGTGPVYEHPLKNLLRQRSTRIGAAAVGLVVVVLAVVMLTRGGKQHGPVAVEVKTPPAAPVKAPDPEPAPAPVAAEPAQPAQPAQPVKAAPPAAKAPPAQPVVAHKAPEPLRPRPVAAAAPAPQAPAPAPERKVMVASAKHVAAASPEPGRRTGAASEEDQRLAKEAYARGNAQLFQGKVEEAITSFKESLKLDSRNPAAQRGLGLAYVQAGNATQAVVFLKRYLKASPTASDRALIEKRIEQLSGR